MGEDIESVCLHILSKNGKSETLNPWEEYNRVQRLFVFVFTRCLHSVYIVYKCIPFSWPWTGTCTGRLARWQSSWPWQAHIMGGDFTRVKSQVRAPKAVQSLTVYMYYIYRHRIFIELCLMCIWYSVQCLAESVILRCFLHVCFRQSQKKSSPAMVSPSSSDTRSSLSSVPQVPTRGWLHLWGRMDSRPTAGGPKSLTGSIGPWAPVPLNQMWPFNVIWH